jgi:hypothetical protein
LAGLLPHVFPGVPESSKSKVAPVSSTDAGSHGSCHDEPPPDGAVPDPVPVVQPALTLAARLPEPGVFTVSDCTYGAEADA